MRRSGSAWKASGAQFGDMAPGNNRGRNGESNMQLRSAGTIRSLTFLNTLLMTTAFAVPAYAQIETVVVTAERKAEDIQTVPIAVTALTGQDLKARQVQNFRDLQFHVPSV